MKEKLILSNFLKLVIITMGKLHQPSPNLGDYFIAVAPLQFIKDKSLNFYFVSEKSSWLVVADFKIKKNKITT